MEKIWDVESDKKHRTIINNWGLYFQVNNIAEMTNFLGNQINEKFLVRSKLLQYKSMTKLRWPIQKMPCCSTFKIWTKYIQGITKCDKSGNLKKIWANG
jgi:hypothetical protein